MKPQRLLHIFFIFSLSTAMENPYANNKEQDNETPEIKDESWHDSLVSWKKYFKGEPTYDAVLKAIMQQNPEAVGDNRITQEQNLNRLLRHLVKTKNIVLLEEILGRLIEQKNIWLPGYEAQNLVVHFIALTRQKFENEVPRQIVQLQEEIERLTKLKQQVESNQDAVLYRLNQMDKHLLELGASVKPTDIENHEKLLTLKQLVEIYTCLREE